MKYDRTKKKLIMQLYLKKVWVVLKTHNVCFNLYSFPNKAKAIASVNGVILDVDWCCLKKSRLAMHIWNYYFNVSLYLD